MAFRIHDSVVRGEIDNRVKGTVRGRIWLEGRVEPVVLELKGNAWPDLAGCLLTFTNPQLRIPPVDLDDLDPLQRGSIGDLTASRKVRVFDVPLEDALDMIRRKEKPPEHIANCLYLEWFSEANGRVLVESADYELTISAPEWRLTPEEDEERAKQAAAGMADFMGKLTEAIEQQRHAHKDPEEKWDEYDYEKFLKECEAHLRKYKELVDKYGDSDEAEEEIAEQVDRLCELAEVEAAAAERDSDELNAGCQEALDEPEPEPDPQREGIDWIRTEEGELRHPLQHRCYECAGKYLNLVSELDLDKARDKVFLQFVLEFQSTRLTLDAVLGRLARGQGLSNDALTVAFLKRALGCLHQAQAALEAVAPKKLLPDPTIAEARKELFEIREGILRLMDEFRGRT